MLIRFFFFVTGNNVAETQEQDRGIMGDAKRWQVLVSVSSMLCGFVSLYSYVRVMQLYFHAFHFFVYYFHLLCVGFLFRCF